MNDMTPFTSKPKDWETDQEVRWCPGCGDYAVLKAVQRTMPETRRAAGKHGLCQSGIGCSSRFPYYMETYGFHTIPRPRAGGGDGGEAGEPRPRRVDHHR